MNFEMKSPSELYNQTKKVEDNLEVTLLNNESFEDVHEKSSNELKEKYPEQYGQYLETLRSLGKERRENFLSDENYCQIQYNLAQASENLAKKDGHLFQHQREITNELNEYIQDGNKVGYIESATGTGKTVIFVEFIKNIINKQEGEEAELKTLLLVPGRDLGKQTVGKGADSVERELDNEEDLALLAESSEEAVGERVKGFAKFAPELNTSCYFDKTKDMSGDVVVMTYQSMNAIVRGAQKGKNLEAMQALMNMDAVVCDEAHRGIGKITGKNILDISPRALKVAFTATPLFSDGRSVASVFGERIAGLSLKEAIEKNLVADVRPHVVNSGLKYELAVSGSDYRDEDLAALNNDDRNMIAVEIAKDSISKGRQGIISCVPGRDEEGNACAHARSVASLLSEQMVVDHDTGLERKIIAQVIDGSMKTEERELIYQQYSEGKIDYLTFVDVLREGWDNNKAKVLINLRPTLSRVLATQLLGRVLRKENFDQKEYSDVYDIVDDHFEDKNINQETQFLAAEILGYKDGQTLAQGKASDGTMSDLIFSGVETKLKINRQPQGVTDKNGLFLMDDKQYVDDNFLKKQLHINKKNLGSYDGQNFNQQDRRFYKLDRVVGLAQDLVGKSFSRNTINVDDFLAATNYDKEKLANNWKLQYGGSDLPAKLRLDLLIRASGLNGDETVRQLSEKECCGNVLLSDIEQASGIKEDFLKDLVAKYDLKAVGKFEKIGSKDKNESSYYYDAGAVKKMLDNEFEMTLSKYSL